MRILAGICQLLSLNSKSFLVLMVAESFFLHSHLLRQLVAHAHILSFKIENPILRLDMLMLVIEMFQRDQWELAINSEYVEEIVYNVIFFLSTRALKNCLICLKTIPRS